MFPAPWPKWDDRRGVAQVFPAVELLNPSRSCGGTVVELLLALTRARRWRRGAPIPLYEWADLKGAGVLPMRCAST